MNRQRITFELAGLAPVGLSILVNGQRFDLAAHEPYIRQDGATTTLMVWQAECATCGAGFVCRSTADHWPAIRRCELHRQPGRPVRAARQPSRNPIPPIERDDDLGDVGRGNERHPA